MNAPESQSESAGLSGPGSKGEVTIVELDRRERSVVRRSAETRAVVPSVELSSPVDARELLGCASQIGCGTTALVVRACALALKEMPRANGAYRDGRLELYSRINIGVALPADGSLEIPIVLDADRKDAEQIERELERFAGRARDGLLSAPELSGGTFTLIDMRDLDADLRSPLIIAPQAAALAVGPIREQPVVRDGELVAAPTMLLTLAVDNRIMFGRHAAAFLGAIKLQIERPGRSPS